MKSVANFTKIQKITWIFSSFSLWWMIPFHCDEFSLQRFFSLRWIHCLLTCLFVCLFVHRLVYVDCGYLPNRDISWPTAISRRAHRLCHAAVYWYLWRNIRLFPGQSAMYKEPAIILQDIHCRALASLCCTYWDRSAVFSKLYQARYLAESTFVSFINACIHSTCTVVWYSLL